MLGVCSETGVRQRRFGGPNESMTMTTIHSTRGGVRRRTTMVFVLAAFSVLASSCTMFNFGNNLSGQLGNGAADPNRNEAVRELHRPALHRCGPRAGVSRVVFRVNSISCVGANDVGQLAVGDLDPRHTHTRVTLGRVSDVAAGTDHGCVVQGGGALWCWGDDSNGQLGIGGGSPQDYPQQLPGAHDWKSVSAGHDSTCGIRTDNTLWCWGDNGAGQLGIGDKIDRSVPTQVGGSTNWRSVTVGASHMCAIKGAGELYCAGDDTFGQLGINDAPTSSTVPIPGRHVEQPGSRCRPARTTPAPPVAPVSSTAGATTTTARSATVRSPNGRPTDPHRHGLELDRPGNRARPLVRYRWRPRLLLGRRRTRHHCGR